MASIPAGFRPECAWKRVPQGKFWLMQTLNSNDAHQAAYRADLEVIGKIVREAGDSCEELSTTGRLLFATQLAVLGYAQRGIVMKQAQARIAHLEGTVASLQAELANATCPTPEPCPPPPPPDPCPALQAQLDEQPQPQESESFGVNLGWLAGGAIAGVSLTYLLRRK